MSDPSHPRAQRIPGDHFGAYLIEAELGRGAQGVVYRARQAGTERPVALKIFEAIDDADMRARFTREAVAAARVEHPNIVPVYEAGDVDGVPFMAMRLIPGPSLEEVLSRFGALQPTRALDILGDIAQAVDAAHAHQLVHRDIKPANVLLDVDDRAYLSDFGVARMVDRPGLTQVGDCLGTVEYMAPEQAEGTQVGAASDRYAFAVLAYELLAGRPPFVHHQSSAVLLAHVRETPPLAAAINPQLPPDIDRVFAQGLAKDPRQRPASASAVVAQLREHLTGRRATKVAPQPRAEVTPLTKVMRRVSNDATQVVARPPAQAPPVEAPPKKRRRRGRGALVTVGLLGAFAALAGSAYAGWSIGDEGRAEAEKQTARAYNTGLREGIKKGRVQGKKAGLSEGRTAGLKAGRAQGKKEGVSEGLRQGRAVPDATPGDYRVALTGSDGQAQWLQGTVNQGECFRVTRDGELIPVNSLPPFIVCD